MRVKVFAATLALAVLLAISIPVIFMQQGSHIWLVTLSSEGKQPKQSFVIREPIVFKAYHYDYANITRYAVACNLTLVSGTDVLWMLSVGGDPAEYLFFIDSEGSYTLRYFCIASDGDTTDGSFSISVSYPTLQVSFNADWGRPLDVFVIIPEYSYDGYSIYLRYKGVPYVSVVWGGRASFVGLPPITQNETIEIVFLGRTNTYVVTPNTDKVRMAIKLSPNPVKAGLPSYATVTLSDDRGEFKPYPITLSVTDPCSLPDVSFYTGFSYQITTPGNVTSQITCTVTATAILWNGASVNASATLIIVPINITRFDLVYTNTTPWNYRFEAVVEVDTTIAGELVLYIDNKSVEKTSALTSVFKVNYETELLPGAHVVTAVFTYSAGSVNRSVVIVVPKHPYTILPPLRGWVYAGDLPTLPNSYMYIYTPSENEMIIYAFYPGDDYYTSNSTVFRILVIYPSITLNEDHVFVIDAAPGARLRVVCIVKGEESTALETTLTSSSYFDRVSLSECDTAYAEYTYKAYTTRVYLRSEARIVVLQTVCFAGLPCVPVAPSSKIAMVKIGDTIYRPGENLTIKPGFYTMYIYLTNGQVLTYPLKVIKWYAYVQTYRTATGAWYLDIRAPPWVSVIVMLASGRTLILSSGTYLLYEEPVYAYSHIADVTFIKTNRI